jgi:peptide-methionine (R)-S-oxide reductase
MESMMINRRILLASAAGITGFAALKALRVSPATAGEKFEIEKTEAEWRAQLTPAQYHILREEGTEPPWSSPLLKEHRKGTFACAGCDLPLYASETKFESGTGWPSFYQPLENAVGKREDRTFGMTRIAIHCRRCGGHLGHVFDDGPKPTGLRYCMDGLALVFHPATPSAT